jgi:peptidoglycan/LPS O-acetylase OafA/YrhL
MRAVSIVLVMLGHLSGTQGFGQLDLGVGDYAHLGVVVFFVISGFLITRLLIAEEAASL